MELLNIWVIFDQLNVRLTVPFINDISWVKLLSKVGSHLMDHDGSMDILFYC